MLGATPPRCTTRSSTRNDSDTLCIWSATNCSVKRPGNVIRMSVAIDAATAIFTVVLLVGPWPGRWCLDSPRHYRPYDDESRGHVEKNLTTMTDEGVRRWGSRS